MHLRDTFNNGKHFIHKFLQSTFDFVIEKAKSSGERSHMGYLVTLLKGLLLSVIKFTFTIKNWKLEKQKVEKNTTELL